jgi:hypothetical protein
MALQPRETIRDPRLTRLINHNWLSCYVYLSFAVGNSLAISISALYISCKFYQIHKASQDPDIQVIFKITFQQDTY